LPSNFSTVSLRVVISLLFLGLCRRTKAPSAMHDLMMAALRRDPTEVDRINAPIRNLHKDLFCEANPIPVKWAVKRIGEIDCPYLRPPLDELAPEHHEILENALRSAGLI